MNLQKTVRRILREESGVPLNVRRRIYILEKLFNIILSNSTPCDYENEEYFIEGILYDLETYLITFELEGMTEEEILSFVKEYFYSEMRTYYINSQEDC